MESKSLEALEKFKLLYESKCKEQPKNLIGFDMCYITIKQDLKRLEEINKVWNDNEPMESVDINDEHLQELYDYINKLEKENEQLKQQRDSLAINNGELCVKVTDLQKENQELKRMNKTLFIHNTEFSLGVPNILNENEKLKKAIEILKNKRVNIDLLLNSSECPTYNFYAKKQDLEDLTQEEYELLKEVLKK